MKVQVLFVLFVFVTMSGSALAFGGNGSYEHPMPTDIEVGDILIGHSSDSDPLIPGYWTHNSMVAYVKDGEWFVVEAWFTGVRITKLSDYMARYDDVAILRVSASKAQKKRAVRFALAQLGKPYDFALWTKQVYGPSYYCSELVWAAYKVVGIDIDAHPGFSLEYFWGVAQQEIYDDSDTVEIYRNSI
ncbi:MAG: hypothetical protein PWQ92_1346 [Thermococcaceae archaeon]|nr:hypothetical protein [Thermococcaceae archaeon]